MRLASLELRFLTFDFIAFAGLTVWASDGFAPWWGVAVALAVAAALCAFHAALSAGFQALTNRFVPPRLPDTLTVEAEGLAVSVARPARTTRIAWTEIAEITAFKSDLGTVDCITLAVLTHGGETLLVDETMGGWDSAVAALQDHLACEPWANWFVSVAFPAFEPNARRIYPLAEPARSGFAPPGDDFAAPDVPDVTSVAAPAAFDLRAYLSNGTGPLLFAVAILLGAVSAFERNIPHLALVAATLGAYTVASRIVMIAALARHAAP